MNKKQLLEETYKEYEDLLEWKRITGDNSSTTLTRLAELEEKLSELEESK